MSAKLIGGVYSRQDATRGPRGAEPDPPEIVGRLAVDRGLKSGKVDDVLLDEATLARVVADGAAILARLAAKR